MSIKLAICSLLFLPVSSYGTTIYTPTLLTGSSSFTTIVGSAAQLTNSSGLSDSTITATQTPVTLSNGLSPTVAQSAYSLFTGTGEASSIGVASKTGGNNPFFIWDLDSDRTINQIILWKYANFAGTPSHALRDFSLQFNTAAQGFTSFAGATSNFNLSLGTTGTQTLLGGIAHQAPDTFNAGNVTARYVKMTLLTNNSNNDSGFKAFSEIRFVVPEPSSFALLGLSVFAIGIRRKR